MKYLYPFLCCIILLIYFSSCKKDNESFVVDIDGNKYKTVKIGNQVWMAENLKTSSYNDGATISNVESDDAWETLTTGAFCYYDNDVSNNAKHGKLYNWDAIGTGMLCPKGWRIPSNDDWNVLSDFLGDVSVGGKMKSTTGWDAPNTGATNESGFSAIGSGTRNQFGSFNDINVYSAWWTSESFEDNNALAWFRGIINSNDILDEGTTIKKRAFSCRCIKD